VDLDSGENVRASHPNRQRQHRRGQGQPEASCDQYRTRPQHRRPQRTRITSGFARSRTAVNLTTPARARITQANIPDRPHARQGRGAHHQNNHRALPGPREHCNAREADAAARTADYIAHAPEGIQPAALDRETWVEFLAVFVEGFPDLQLELLDSSADEVMVAQRILFTGTHTGKFAGPGDRQQRPVFGVEINRMVDGRVAEHWFQLDAVTLVTQLGLHVIAGALSLARLLASLVRRLFGKRRRKVPS
jgi:predicted ester cyclase